MTASLNVGAAGDADGAGLEETLKALARSAETVAQAGPDDEARLATRADATVCRRGAAVA